MKNLRLQADRFAQALADALPELADLKAAGGELDALAGLVRQSEPLRRVLANPVIPAKSKEKAVLALAERLGAGKPVRALLGALARAEALRLLPDLAAAVNRLIDRREGVHEARITSPHPLEPALRDRFALALGRLAGGRVRLLEKVDPALLGGVVVEMSGTIFDGSLRTSLGRLKNALLAGALR